MNKSTSNVVAFADPSVEKDALTALIRQGAQQLLSRAIEIELEERMAELLRFMPCRVVNCVGSIAWQSKR